MKYLDLSYMKKCSYLPSLLVLCALLGAAYFWEGHRPTVTADVSHITATRFVGETPGVADAVEFRISFRVTAFGGDVFLDGQPNRGFAGNPASQGFGWSLSPESTIGSPSVVWLGLSPADGRKSRDGGDRGARFYIADGHTRTFDFRVRVETGHDNGAVGVQVDSIRWGESTGGTAGYLAVFDSEAFKSDLVTGLYVR